MPKGSISGPHFNRSILILTPQRALKFTATSQDRHFIWLTALSFLSHSPLSVNDLTAMPPPPPEDQLLAHPPAPPSLAGSLRRRAIRDSIRIAKGSRPQTGFTSYSTDVSGLNPPHDEYSRPPSRDYYDPTQDPALPPTIKRFHARKRSNTAPRAPPSSFRAYTASSRDIVPPLPAPGGYAGTVSSSVIASTNGSDRGLYTPSLGVQSINSSRRGSEASNTGRPMPHQLYPDPSQATMRMDAFMDTRQPISRSPVGQAMVGGGPFPALRSGTWKKKDMGYWGIEDGRSSISPVDSLMQSEMMAAAESSARPSVDSRMTDPFRGF
jgi:Meiotic cell cortex C-terminal pleckstrin homology